MKDDLPDDLIGDVLRRMRASGDRLSLPREIDFSVVFPDEECAGKFASRFGAMACQVKVDFTEIVPELPWDVTVTKYMVPTHGAIADFEMTLGVAAANLGGRNDGWGCFERTTQDQ